jgi:hypothetical protein
MYSQQLILDPGMTASFEQRVAYPAVSWIEAASRPRITPEGKAT